MPALFSPSTATYLKQVALPAYKSTLILECSEPLPLVIESLTVAFTENTPFEVLIKSDKYTFFSNFSGRQLSNEYEIGLELPASKKTYIDLMVRQSDVPKLYHYRFNGGQPCSSCEKEKADFALWQYRQSLGIWAYPANELAFNLMFHVKQ